MNQSQIHPALRQQPSHPSAASFSSPQKSDAHGSPETRPHFPQPSYSPLQSSSGNPYQGNQTPQYYGTGSVQSPDDAQDGTSPTAGPPGAEGSSHDPNDLKRPRACEACRQLKVKCEPDENSPTGSCKRCAKAGRQCVVTAPSRKRQKKTDSRVAELEKKIDALTATLVARGGNAGPDGVENLDPAIAQAGRQQQQSRNLFDGGSPYATTRSSVHSPSQTSGGLKRKMPDDYDYFSSELHRSNTSDPKSQPMSLLQAAFNRDSSREPARKRSDSLFLADVIERRIIDYKSASRCFERYVVEMCDQLPLVVFPPGTKMEDIRKNRPLLFLAVLAVSAGTIRPDIQLTLVSECTKILADRIVFRGEKSLELVQTIQVMTLFYIPPERYEELNFNQLIHIAAVMALDIGMGKRSRVGGFAMWREYVDRKQPLPDSGAAETRRCWLGCYYMCANSAMSLRRPLLIRWSPYAEECLDILASSPDALPSDRWLCHLVRAQHIAEDIGFQFSMDDPASQLSLTDSKTQYHLKAFERQLKEWQESAPKELRDKPVMKHTEAIINLYMHEIAMHHNHNIDDFKPPYNINPIEGPPDPDSVTPAHIESLSACLQSIHAAFNAFLAMDLKSLRALPTLFFVRNSYAAVALIKMYSAVAAKGSKFATIFKPEDLKVESYMDRMINTLAKTGEGGASRVAYKFSFIFTMLKNWHLKRIEPNNGSNGTTSNVTTPGALMPAPLTAGRTRAIPQPGMKTITSLFNKAMATLPDANSTAAAMAWNPPSSAPPSVDDGSHQNPTTTHQQTSPSRSGLQMLSDAAMRNSPVTTAGVISTGPSSKSSHSPSSGTTALPTGPVTPQQHQHQHSQFQPQQTSSGAWNMAPTVMTTGLDAGSDMMNSTSTPAGAGAGYPPTAAAAPTINEMDNLGFTSEELMALGNLMDDPGWFSFGLEQGGWAF